MKIRLFDVLCLVSTNSVIVRMLDGTIDYEGAIDHVPFDLLNFEVKSLYVTEGKIDVMISHLNHF